MARMNRREVLADGEVQVVHCINRCVRRAFLCGKDPLTGVSYEHRREMIRKRMEFLAGVMGVEVLAFSVMSNHFHIILRNRPDVVAEWSDEEVAQRWWQLCPARKEKDGTPKDATEFEINSIKSDKEQLKERRIRLGSISWLMRFLCEKVARESNKQDECTGRFWEGRFKAQVLLDEAALLACMQYVDLNPVRARIAKSPEKSDFTSAQARIQDLQSAEENKNSNRSSVTRACSAWRASRNTVDKRIEHGPQAGWISPMALTPKRKAVRDKATKRRASNKGCLPIDMGDYLHLLDWTGRQVRSGKRGAMPKDLKPIFDRLGVSADLWVDCVVHFRKWFRSSVGRPKSMEANSANHGHNRALSIKSARQVFV